MTLNVEEYPLSKSTSVSLCDTEVSLSQVVQKSNRAFDVTNSILNVRNNSYTRKVYEAFKDNQDMLGTVSIKPGIIDLERLSEEIKLKVADELNRNAASYKALLDKYKAKHEEYMSNGILKTMTELNFKYSIESSSAFNPYDTPTSAEELQSQITELTPAHTAFRESYEHTTESNPEVITAFDKVKNELKKYNEYKLKQYIFNTDSLKAKVKQLEVLEGKEKKSDADKELIQVLNQSRIDLNEYNTLANQIKESKNILQTNQYTYLDKAIQDIKRGTHTSSLYEAYQLYIIQLNLMSASGVSNLTDIKSLCSTLLSELKAVDAKAKTIEDQIKAINDTTIPLYELIDAQLNEDGELTGSEEIVIASYTQIRAIYISTATLRFELSKYNYIYPFRINGELDNPNFLNPNPGNTEHEPKVTGISYCEPDVNYHAFKYLQQIHGHSTLKVDYITDNWGDGISEHLRVLTAFDYVNIDEKCPYLIEANYSLLNNISEKLEFVLPNKKVNHVIYSFRLGNTYSYGYLTDEDFTYEITKPIELQSKSIPYIPIKKSGVMLPSEKRLEELPLKYEEILRKCYIPYYELDKNISSLLQSKVITSTDDSSVTKPYSNYINNIGLQLGIPTNTQSNECCKYLVELFKGISKYGKKDDFDTYTLDIYLPETLLQFKSETCLTEIGFSYIVVNTKSGSFKPICKLIPGDIQEITYEGLYQRNIPQGVFVANMSPGILVTHIHGNKLFYDSSILQIGYQKSKNEYIEVIVHGFTYTNTLNPAIPIEAVVDNSWRIGTYLSTNYDTSKYKEYRKVTDTVRSVFGKYTNDATTDVTVVSGKYYDYAKKKLGDTKVIEPQNISLCSVVIPLFYYDIFDKESDYHTQKMYNALESIYYDSINLVINSSLTIPQYDPFDDTEPSEFITRQLRTKTLMAYLDYFINTKPEDVYKRKEEKDKTTYELFRDKNYVGIGLTYYRDIPSRNEDKSINPVFLPLQKKRELEVKRQLTQSTSVNLYQDKNSHINNALTGVYKPIVLIEPLINIGDKYNKPMFNN